MAVKKKPRKSNAGRPSPYYDGIVEQVYKLTLLGATDQQLADFFDVCVATVHNWKNEHPEFLEALQRGKEEADATIAESLFHRAKGYSHPEVHISNYQGQITQTPLTKHYPPDTAACIIWLKNRQPTVWRDKHEHEHKINDLAELIQDVERRVEEGERPNIRLETLPDGIRH